MKKIYSYVLMAAALLVGTSAWADEVSFTGTTRAELQAAIDAAASGTTLKFQNNVTLADGPIWLGTEDINESAKSIILDLNGHSVTTTGSLTAGGVKQNYYMFIVSHGELLVRNTSKTTSNIMLTGVSADGSQIFSVYGSYRSSRWNADGTMANDADPAAINTRDQGYFSHLEIGERVKVIADAGCLGTGIAVDKIDASTGGMSKALTLNGKTLKYHSNFLNGGYGFAYGARVDLYGDIQMISNNTPGTAEAPNKDKAYGIKTNGNLESPRSTRTVVESKKKMNGVKIAYLENYEANRAEHANDTLDAAYVYVHENSNVKSNENSTRSVALYASGFAKWFIEGNCEGNSGLYASSGDIDIHNATIEATSGVYNPVDKTGGKNGSGSAIAINSRESYPGDITLDISGDTYVEAQNGYAIEEAVTSAADTKVDIINISGGEFVGGTVPDGKGGTMQGTITISEETAESTEGGSTTIVVAGGVTIEGGESSVTFGNEGNLGDIIDETSTYATTVTDPETGKQTVVVKTGSEPIPVPNTFDINSFVSGDINLSDEALVNKDQVFDASGIEKMIIGTLQINPPTSTVTLTIKEGRTIQADNVFLGYNGKLILEPGARLIVTGEGVTSMKPENIVFRANDTKQAKFLLDPLIDKGKHPKVTVEYVSTKSYYVDGAHHQWERFGIPTHKAVESFECLTPGLVTDIQEFGKYGWSSLGFLTGGTPYAAASKMSRTFGGYNMLVNSPTPTNAVYRFTGELVGNVDADLVLDHEWTPFANSYLADVDLAELLDRLNGDVDVTPTVYVHTPSGPGYVWDPVSEEWFGVAKLAPLQSFVLYNEAASVRNSGLDYEDMVWNPAVSSSPAPERRYVAANNNYNTAKLRIVVTNEQGVWDNVKMSESAINANNSPKFMNDDVNIFAHADDKKLAIVAAEDLADTYLGFSTVSGGEFTISFTNVDGREFDLVDLEANLTVEVAEGSTYTFTADKNTVADYRFKLIERRKVATDAETISAEKKVSGVYTIMGQYLGEMNIWNTLPAGVYIVDGAKRVK